MGRRRVSTHDCLVFKSRLSSHEAAPQSYRRPPKFAPPACFVSALAIGLIIGGGAAAGDPGNCTSSVAGVDLTCTGTITNPSSFTAQSGFTVDIGTTSPSESTAEIIRTNSSDHAGLKIDGKDFSGTINMTRGSSIIVDPGIHGSTFRNGLSVLSSATGESKTITIDIDGSIITNDPQGDALRLEGQAATVFDVTIHRHGTIGGEDGDDAVMVTGAQSLLLKNYGEIVGGDGESSIGGEGINVGKGTRIAADGVTIKNRGVITGSGEGADVNGQGITVFGAGDVTIDNGRGADVVGASQGIRVEANGAVSITNDGHIEGQSKSGIEVADGTTVNVVNRSRHTIEGATNGVYTHDVDEANVDNDHGHIVGHDGDGVRIDDIDGNVSVKNRFGLSSWSAARITGSDDAVHVNDVEGNVSIDNRVGGKIVGYGGDGVHVNDAEGDVTVNNSILGSIRGRDDGVHISDIDDDVTIRNSFGGSIAGRRGDGVNVRDAGDDVEVANNLGGSIEGRDNGVNVRDVRDNVTIDNSLRGSISGGRNDGVHIRDVRGDVTISNILGGSIEGRDDGIDADDVRGDVTVNNGLGGKITGRTGDGIKAANVGNDVTIKNQIGGEVKGHDDGVHVEDVRDHVTVDNSVGGSIVGYTDDGVDIDDARNDVEVLNRFGGNITGRDNGVQISDINDDVRVDNSFGGTVTGWRGNGLQVEDIDGSVSVKNSRGGTISGDDDGVHIAGVEDGVRIDNRFGGTIKGRDDDGVDVHDVDDDVRVDNRFGGTVRGDDNGVKIHDVDGSVTVANSFGGEIRGKGANGVDIDDVEDDVRIDNRAGGSIKGHNDGIHADDVDGNVRVDNSFGGTVTGWRGNGLRVEDIDGSVSVKNSRGGTISGDDDGVHIADVEDGVRIDNRFGGTIKGRDDDGVDVHDVDDDVRVDNRFGGTVRGDDNGVKVHDVDGRVTVANSFGGEILGKGDNGVDIDNVEDDVRIDNRAGGSIKGHNDGIHADDVDGNVRVDNGSGSIRGRRGDGIDVSADGGVTVNNGRRGSIKGSDSAIQIDAESAEINSAGLIRGSGAGDPTIKLSTDDGATINNYRSGKIVGHDHSPTDLIVEAHGGAVAINNHGTMLGRIDLSDAGNSQQGNVFNNTSNHSWTFAGTSELGGGLADTFNNTGTVYTTNPGDPRNNDITVLAGVETFNNGNAFKSGTIDLQDGFTGDVTTLSPTGSGSLAFNGAAAHSYLKVDSFLSSPSDSSSDRLIINGDVSGKTAIDVNNVNPGFGSYNPTGIEVVSASGRVAPENFFLRNGPIDTGLFDYNLYLNDSSQWVLASAPNRTFFELPSLTSAAQSMWHDASGVWLDRTADLRASLEHPCVFEGLKGGNVACPSAVTSGGWVKALGVTEQRTPGQSFSLFNTSQTYKTKYEQNGGGVLAGYDIVRRAEDGQSIWLAGVMGGYLRSVVDFEDSATNADFEGGAVGGYVTYLKGPWFLDAKLMANIGNVDYSASHGAKDNAGTTSLGGVLDTGYRVERGRYFIEPGATLAYVNTDIDNLAVYGTSVNFSDGDSLRGRLGVRLGATFEDQQAKYEPFLGVSAWYEFLGDNTTNVASGGYVLTATDNLTGTIGEVTGGVNVYSLTGDGVSGFLKGNLQFGKDDYLGFGGSFGVRVDW